MPLLALLAALSAAPAAALSPARCLNPASGAAPSTLEELRACQDKARAAAVAAAAAKGAPLTDAQLDALDDYQRAEARRFFARSRVAARAAAAAAGPGAAPAEVADLGERLKRAAGDGRAGITPAMAEDIRATLLKQEGALSPEMEDLLGAVSRDGAKLTPDTMKKLQGAGRAAKGEGLDLGIDPDLERELLGRDFEADKPAFNSSQ
jgi:hypothetical protein